uniref:Uncharacterized protein n=1 Tax=Triticum urartu TaxID=4572 RepID=A0A8R7QJQ2_TRIUA
LSLSLSRPPNASVEQSSLADKESSGSAHKLQPNSDSSAQTNHQCLGLLPPCPCRGRAGATAAARRRRRRRRSSEPRRASGGLSCRRSAAAADPEGAGGRCGDGDVGGGGPCQGGGGGRRGGGGRVQVAVRPERGDQGREGAAQGVPEGGAGGGADAPGVAGGGRRRRRLGQLPQGRRLRQDVHPGVPRRLERPARRRQRGVVCGAGEGHQIAGGVLLQGRALRLASGRCQKQDPRRPQRRRGLPLGLFA